MKHQSLGPLATAVAVLVLAAACASDGEEAADVDSSAVDTTTADGEAAEADPPEGTSADQEPPALLLIMDASGSMNRQDVEGETRIAQAKQALGDVIDELPDEQHVGLRVYGHRHPEPDRDNGCQDTELIHPVEPLDREALTTSIDGYEALGYTPIGLSLEEGAGDLSAEGPRTIVLVSDGEETCDTDPCAAARQLADEGIDLVIHTVGFALGDNEQARDELGCIAEAGGGEFVDAGSAGELTDALEDMSVREDRSFAAEGAQLAGAPIPSDADTGQVDTSYTDVVLAAEVNYYRFEVSPGTEVRGEVVMEAAPDLACATNPDSALNRLALRAKLTDESGSTLDVSGSTVFDNPWNDLVVHTNPTTVESDELWLEVSTDSCGRDADAELDVEILLTEL